MTVWYTMLFICWVFNRVHHYKRLLQFSKLLAVSADDFFLSELSKLVSFSLCCFSAWFVLVIVDSITCVAEHVNNPKFSTKSDWYHTNTILCRLTNWHNRRNWMMYDLGAFSVPGCVVDPPYNASYCGFSDHNGCIPLNGCAVPAAFPFCVTFIMFGAFLGSSLFIGVIVDG